MVAKSTSLIFWSIGLRSVLRRRLKLVGKKEKKKDKEKKAKENEELPKAEKAPVQGASSATQLLGSTSNVVNGSPVPGPSSISNTPAPGPAAGSDPLILKRPASRVSLKSIASSVSTSSSKAAGQEAGKQQAIAEERAEERKKEDETILSKVAPPAEALRPEDEDEDADEFFEEHAFDHPST